MATKLEKDEAAGPAQQEFWELEEKHKDAIKALREWGMKHLAGAGYKRIGRIVCGKGEYVDSV